MTSPPGSPAASVIDRRTLLRYGAAAGAAAAIGPAVSAPAGAADTGDARRVLPAPTPIPGGLQIPGLGLIHVFAPGPPEVTLPFSGTQLQGLDVEPSVITNYTGTTAVAFHVGSDGARYNLETDMRAIQGTYIATDGSRRHGTFGFI
jgi:hypothetical protein